jgi:two-component system, chemotaxis family, response regulator Rcp1
MRLTSRGRAGKVLLVEDNPGDAHLTIRALRSAKVANEQNVDVVEDGEKALAYLRQQGAYRDRARPDLVLLDLNLPKVDGGEVLKVVKADPDLRRIPVIVLTGSFAEDEVLHSSGLHANAYVRKPAKRADLIEVADSIRGFWFSEASQPRRNSK